MSDTTETTPTPAPAPDAPRFSASLAFITNRGRAPLPFLGELLAWGKKASIEIFSVNRNPVDAYAVIKSYLGTPRGKDASGTPVYTWDSDLHRRAAMLELMRVHAGRESSWNWGEGVDLTNKNSVKNKTGEETGIFQVSPDSELLDSPDGKDIMGVWAKAHGLDNVDKFIETMKSDHVIAMEYYARLVRVSIAWAGPLIRHGQDSVYPYLNRDSMREFLAQL